MKSLITLRAPLYDAVQCFYEFCFKIRVNTHSRSLDRAITIKFISTVLPRKKCRPHSKQVTMYWSPVAFSLVNAFYGGPRQIIMNMCFKTASSIAVAVSCGLMVNFYKMCNQFNIERLRRFYM